MPQITLKVDDKSISEYICDMCEANKAEHVIAVLWALRMSYVVCNECKDKLPRGLIK